MTLAVVVQKCTAYKIDLLQGERQEIPDLLTLFEKNFRCITLRLFGLKLDDPPQEIARQLSGDEEPV